MSPRELTDKIKQLAIEAGFTKAGVTSAAPFDQAADHLTEWVNRGMHGLMGYMERGHEKRRDVREILPGASSILSLALNYYHPDDYPSDSLKISRYAWGTDYHLIIPKMLEDLLDKIKQFAPEAEGRYYVDTGPLLEKAIAERAGIGWIGKHSNVITREVGSWVFLSEIILNLDLVPDAPAEDLCGTCTACIDACPTDAIVQNQVVDATRCVSYLTIEMKPEHPIPEDLDIAGWLYGCDICQDVCPWNRFQSQSKVEEFKPRIDNLSLSKEKIIKMEQAEFSERFRKSPVKRTKLAGLKRNVAGHPEAQRGISHD